MTRDGLADRILTYSDALVAFALVNGLAFVIALAEPEIRCSITGIVGVVVTVNLAFPILISVALVALRRFELALRAEQRQDPTVAAFWRWMQWARFGLVWLFAAMVLGGLWAATTDPLCAAPLGG